MKEIIINSLGLDPGNGYIKMKTSTHEVLEPFVFSDVSSTHQLNNFDFSIEIDKLKYIIGTEAMNSGFIFKSLLGESDVTRYNEFFYKLLSAFIIKNYSFDNSKVIVQNLVIGLPNNIYSQVNLDVSKKLTNSIINILVNDQLKALEIKKVKIVPQPFGTYYSSKDYIGNYVYIVDYGFGSVDYTYFKNNNLVENFGTNNGIRKTLVQIQKFLEEEFNGMQLMPHQVLKVLETAKVRYGGEDKKVDPKYLRHYMNTTFEMIIDEITQRHNNLAALDLVVFTGGASNEIRKNIADLNLKNVVICDKPQIANAIGYYNIGCNM
ncbi:MAG: hypothetical protein ACK5K7_06690 [Bacilli bacterium]